MQEKEIREISCSAHNCKYHQPGDKCTAGHIKVGTPTAVQNGDTLCSTFQNCQGHC